MIIFDLVFVIIFSSFLLTPAEKIGDGSCVEDLHLHKGGGCCQSNETCCIGECCCDQNCYDFGDCCLDVWLIQCLPKDDQTPIPPSCYTCAELYGINDGCCTSECRTNEQFCYCDQECYHYGDCCVDISDIGCKCNFTCSEHFDNNSTGCCQEVNCNTSCCHCDEECHHRGDCCDDIETWGCLPPTTQLPLTTMDPTEEPTGFCPKDVTVHNRGTYNITWFPAPPGYTSYQDCPSPRNGTASRFCFPNGTWNISEIEDCISMELIDAMDSLVNLSPEMVVVVTSNVQLVLIAATADRDTDKFPEDVKLIIETTSETISILQNSTEVTNSSYSDLENNYLDIFNNLLDKRYKKVYDKFQNESGSSNHLITVYEEFSAFAATFMAEYDDSNEVVIKERENIIFYSSAIDATSPKDAIFPIEAHNYFNSSDRFPEIMFNKADIRTFSNNALPGERVAIVNSYINNIANFLYHDDLLTSNSEVASTVLSSVISSRTQSGRLPAVLNITSREYYQKNLTNPRCAFWNPDQNYGHGKWSTEGIEVIQNTTTILMENFTIASVACRIYHQTPFSMLVDVHDIEYDSTEKYALEIVGYIGVSISIVCLILTILLLMLLGKQLVLSTQYFIHFNLSIALLGGYITFLLFIDERFINVTNSKIGCSIVAAVLQFFFTAAFSWMMCEGILLFLLLVVVFTSIGKRWYVFLIIGWGLPVIPVAISAGLIHEQYGSPGRHCWIDIEESKTAIWAFVIPMLIFLLINVFFMIMSVRALILYHRNKKSTLESKKGYSIFKKSLIGALTLLPLLGITWVIGLLAVDENTTVFAWLFVVLNSLQGLFIFGFNIVRNEKIRENFVFKICRRHKRKPKAEKTTARIKRSDSFRSSTKRSPSTQFLMTKTSNLPLDSEIENEDDENEA